MRGLDSLQTDYYNLYENYFSPLGIAMLTIDMPPSASRQNGR
ncbi:alpha/beta hydrolase [Klebsiella pneumoniae subsp. pneumoniae]|nr:alpha/beta hydrolase [Klebsiella pneumoniae subsp. pneumoniae]